MRTTTTFKFALIVLLLMSIIPMMPVYGQEDANVTITADSVRVRMGPDTAYNILGYVHSNEIYKRLGRDTTGFWIQIEYRGNEGWVNWNYVEMNQAEILAEPVSEVVTGRVMVDTLNARQEPLYNAEVINQFGRGQLINLIGRDDGSEWVQFQTDDGTMGWIARTYINIGDENYFLRIPLLSRVPGVGANINE